MGPLIRAQGRSHVVGVRDQIQGLTRARLYPLSSLPCLCCVFQTLHFLRTYLNDICMFFVPDDSVLYRHLGESSRTCWSLLRFIYKCLDDGWWMSLHGTGGPSWMWLPELPEVQVVGRSPSWLWKPGNFSHKTHIAFQQINFWMSLFLSSGSGRRIIFVNFQSQTLKYFSIQFIDRLFKIIWGTGRQV